MTLKNKKMHLLENDVDNPDDVVDIFEQYNSSDSDNIIDKNSKEGPNNLTRPKNDSEEDEGLIQQNISENTPVIEDGEKKWEQEYEEDVFNIAETTNVIEKNVETNLQNTAATKDEMQNMTDNKEETDDFTDEKNTIIPSTIIKKSKKQPENKQVTPTQEIQISTDKKTIMIVDDDVDTLEMYADVFLAANYNVIRAFDGLEALSLLGDYMPDVIFTGIVMPRMDGFTMLESIKKNERTANIPVVINSHLGRDTDKDRARELGAKDFVIRGFTQPKEVLERVGALLLKSEYIFHFDVKGKDIQRLTRDLGTADFLKCPHGQEMVLKLSIDNEKKLIFSARFSCIDEKNSLA